MHSVQNDFEGSAFMRNRASCIRNTNWFLLILLFSVISIVMITYGIWKQVSGRSKQDDFANFIANNLYLQKSCIWRVLKWKLMLHLTFHLILLKSCWLYRSEIRAGVMWWICNVYAFRNFIGLYLGNWQEFLSNIFIGNLSPAMHFLWFQIIYVKQCSFFCAPPQKLISYFSISVHVIPYPSVSLQSTRKQGSRIWIHSLPFAYFALERWGRVTDGYLHYYLTVKHEFN